MKSLRTFAAQSDVRKRITQASLGGATLFCLSAVLSQNAHADSTSSLSDSSSIASSTLVPALTPDPSSSTPLASAIGLSDGSTVQSVDIPTHVVETSSTSITLDTVSSKIETATVTVQTAVTNSTTALQAIPDVQAKVAELPVAQQAVTDAATAVQDATVKIQLAQQSYETATATAAVVPVAQAGVDAATATVADKTSIVAEAQSTVDTATATVASTQTTLTTAQDAQPALDAAAACTEGTACVHYYTANAELGPLNDQVAAAQKANSDAWWDGVNWANATFPPDRATYQAAVVASDAAHADVVAAAPVVATATDTANAAQDAAAQAQAAADASIVTTTTNGVKATVYAGTGRSPALPADNATPILTTTVPNIAFNWGSGVVMNSGLADRVIVKFEGTITVPQEAVAVKYAVSSDDGSMMYIDGQLAINNWKDQGTTWSPYSPVYNTTTDKQQDFVLWYYENGGGATCTLGWMVFSANGTGYFTTPGSSAFATTIVTKDPVLVAAATTAQSISAQAAADLATAQTNLDAANAADAKAWADRGAAYQKLIEDYTHLSEIEAARPALAQAITDAQAAYDAKLTERNAAWDAYTGAVHAASDNAAAIPVAQAAYDQAMQNLTTAEQNLTVSVQNLTTAQQNLTVQQSVLNVTQATAQRDLNTANAAANTALDSANIAATTVAQSTQTIQDEIAKKAAADAKAAADLAAAQAAVERANQIQVVAPAPAPEPAPAPTPEPSSVPAPVVAPNPQPDPAPVAPAPDVAPAPEDKPTDTAPTPPAPTPAPDKPAPSTPPAPAPDKPTPPAPATDTPSKPVPQVQPAPPPAPSSQPPVTPNLVPNNPNSLPDTTPKPAPAEVLVPHVQVDKPGVENGGIAFFGTKSAPQVVGEDGKLTPPAPPPGSGLPIPPEAITTSATFIGQVGGTTFNAPDIAVPVIETPVTGVMAAVPGVQALNHAFVAMSNIGNDMSPVTRKKAKKILVLTVAVGAIVRRRFGN